MKLKRLKKIAMKLFFGMLLTILFTGIIIAKPSVGQGVRTTNISLSFANAPLKKVLKSIEKQTNCSFFFDDNVIRSKKNISINLENKNLDEILEILSRETKIEFLRIANSIAIKEIHNEQAQQDSTVSITGKVVDAKTNTGMPGVSIRLKGFSGGTVSDNEGNYNVIVSGSKSILQFSFLGYEQQEVTVGSQRIINVKLSDATALLKDVVVIGYGESSRKQLTSSVSSVSGDDLNKGTITDLSQLLQGKVAGLTITADGNPNKPAAVILRGVSTLNSSQSPLYVIDGIPGSDISTVTPDDISSIDVLKDAAATSIYGNRAANGVIMITTKRGKSGQMQVSLNSYVGFEKVSSELKMMDANELRTFVKNNNQTFTPADDLGADTNWQKAIERSSAVSQSHNLTMMGGTENSNYKASLSYLNKEGILLKSNLSRVIARLSVEQYALDHHVKFGLNVANSNSVANNTPQLNTVLLQAIKHLPVAPVKNADGSYFENFNNSNYFNPVAMIDHGKDDTKYNNLVAGFTTHVVLPVGFTYDLNISYQNSTSLHGEFYDSYYSGYNSYHFYNNPDPPATHVMLNFGTNGSALRSTYQNTSKILETYLTWNRVFGPHTVNAVVGYSWQNNVNGDGFQATSTNFPVDNIGYNNLALSNYSSAAGYIVNFGADGIYQETRLISDFARLNYSFQEKYMLQGSVRRDGGSVFGTNNKWGYFPSVGAAWRLGQENFMRNLGLFDDLKLRASYGVTGNSTGFNAYTAQFISGSLGTYYYNGVQTAAYGPTQAANFDLKWEKITTTNAGLDFSLLKNAINGSVDWYDKKTEGMIYSYNVDKMLVPQGSIVANGGSMSNKGIEVSLEVDPVRNKNFNWTSSLTLAHNTNKIISLSNPLFVGGDSVRQTQPDGGGQTGSTLQILKAGKPLGQFFTLQYAGKDTGMVSQYVDHNGNPVRNPAIGTDYHYAGSPQPKLLVGWSNTFRYKNFDLNIFVRGCFGNKIFNVTRADLFRPTTASTANILEDVAGESSKDLNAYKYSTRFIEDGSYVRLDNATLGYNFRDILKTVKNIRIYASVNNLFVITNYTGIDPEVNLGGIAPGIDSNNFYPKTRTVLLGVNVQF